MNADLTINDLSRLTGRHPETLRALARRDLLPGVYRIGGRWMMTSANAAKLRREDADAPSSRTNGGKQ